MRETENKFQYLCNVRWKDGLVLPSHLQSKIEIQSSEYRGVRSLWYVEKDSLPSFWEWYNPLFYFTDKDGYVWFI